MNKRFTLIEIVVSIVILSILTAIVILGTLDLRKKAIANSINANVKQLQTATDKYFLENETLPVKDSELLTLSNPQFIDITHLEKEGYLKKDLDTSKVKQQYYWVDVFGKVWGSTVKDIHSINLLKTDESKFMEFIVGEEATGYKLYEVSGYKSISAKDTKEDLVATLDSGNLVKKKYAVVEETKVTGKGEKVLNFSIADGSSDYLVSIVDKYGLETAPYGKYNSPKNPPPYLFNKEGVYEFEIENNEDMYWVDFYYLADIPVGASVNFKFKVKDSEGNYGDWTEDYFSLKESTGIVVQVDMKGDGKGNNPSLYDVRVVFKFKDDEVTSNPPVYLENPLPETFVCPESSVSSTLGHSSWKKGKGTMVKTFYNSEFEEFNPANAPKVSFSSYVTYEVLSVKFMISHDNQNYVDWDESSDTLGKCMLVIYDLDIKQGPPNPEPIRNICGTGGTNTTPYIKDKGNITYRTVLGENQKMSKLDVVNQVNENSYTILSVRIEYSANGMPYKAANSIEEIPAGSCVIIIYEVEKQKCKDCLPPPIPEVKTCDELKNCPEPCGEKCKPINPDFCIINCEKTDFCKLYGCDEEECVGKECEDEICPPSENCGSKPPVGPNPEDKELTDPEWTTVDRISFFGHGAVNQLIRWYKAEHTEEIKDEDNTRIIYRYAKSGGYTWSNEYEDFTTTNIARSVRATAYIQVRTKELKNVLQENYPEVLSMKFYNERGFLDMSMVQPTLVITPQKDNNVGRDTFSTSSHIKWEYVAADPRNKEIVAVEWDGDIREQYPAGTYEIKARVQNDVAIWSEWVTYMLEVKEEKPVAVIDYNVKEGTKNFISVKSHVIWTAAKSYDPDGDKLKKVEWAGDNKTTYTKGEYKIKLRVQDEEGHWSDWAEYEFSVLEEGIEVARVEAEDKRLTVWSGYYNKVVSDANYSGGAYGSFRGEYAGSSSSVSLTADATGFDVYLKNVTNAKILIDGEVYESNVTEKDTLKRIVGLKQGVHTISVMTYSNSSVNEVDYFTVYSMDSKVNTSSVKPNVLDETGKVIRNTPSFSPVLNEKYRFDYVIDKDSKETISILNKNNEIVYKSNTRMTYGGTRGVNSFTWNGLNADGVNLSTGTYKIVFDYIGPDGKTKSKYTHDVFLDTNVPVSRIEGEDKVLTKVSTYSGLMNSANYSNGQALRLRGEYAGSGSSSEIVFKGTGIDIQFLDANGTQLFVDGVKYDTITYSSPTKYSIRNLENTTHTILLKNNVQSNTTGIDYYDLYNETDKTKILNSKQEVLSSSNVVIKESNEINNRLGNRVVTTYQIDYDSTVEYLIKNSNGEKVHVSKGKVQGGTKGIHKFYWDGKASDGSLLPTGTYSLTMTFEGSNGSTNKYNFTYEVKNISPIARIEAEDKVLTTISTNSKNPLASDSYSNGKAVYMVGEYAGSSSSITTNFVGTGVDIAFISANNVSIYIDSVLIETVSYSTPTIYSIRDLSESNHKLVIEGKGSNSRNARLDYFDIYSNNDSVSILSTKQSILDSTGKAIQDGNTLNVLHDYKVKTEYQLDYNAKVAHIVENSAGKVIYQEDNLSKSGGTNGFHSFIWDGKDNSGAKQPAGIYQLTVRMTSVSGKVTKRTYEIEVRNGNSIGRIEAENSEVAVSGGSSGIRTGETFSGGKARYIGGPYAGSGSSIAFTFKGTGAELKMQTNRTSIIEVTTNGVKKVIHSGYTNSDVNYFSISGLSEGTHTITVRHTGGSYNAIVDYLDVY